MSTQRTLCGELRAGDLGKRVVLFGWVQRVRDHGGVVFVDLRDRAGIVQLVFHPDVVREPEMSSVRKLRAEFVLTVHGKVARRAEGMENPNLATGQIEVTVERFEILNECKVLPFSLEEPVQASEELRLKYRYLDLRRPRLREVLLLRHRLGLAVRNFLSGRGFVEIETPILVRPTPEGARDYLVPSRVHPGSFYALPQSPQLYKQILMVAGFERYFQMARCLRDEDLRADRQPEHTQLDLEMSFVREEDVFEVIEAMFESVLPELDHAAPRTPFKRISYRDALERFGTDKPDLRIPVEVEDITDLCAGSGYGVFERSVQEGGRVKALSCPWAWDSSRSRIQSFESLARKNGAAGLSWFKVTDGSLDAGITKYLNEQGTSRFESRFGRQGNTLVLMVSGEGVEPSRILGKLRIELGKDYLAGRPEELSFAWVTGFPVFERDEDSGRWVPAHHIFSMPFDEDLSLLNSDPGRVRGRVYDLVCNGIELASGSIRNHRRKTQEMLLEVIGISRPEAERRFGFLLEALEYGAPPHGGIAMGLDRLTMILAGKETIRDTIAFPKTYQASSPMDGSPAPVESSELKELHLKLVVDDNEN